VTRIETPTTEELEDVRSAGSEVGYRGAGIYVRYRAILEVLHGLEADRILVVGCGHGIFDRLLPENSQVVGVDIAEDEIETATKWARDNRPNYRYVMGRVEDLDIPPDWADITIVSEVLEHIPESEVPKLLSAAIRLTDPRGRILVTVPNYRQLRNRARRLIGLKGVFMDADHDREYTIESARSTLGQAGLEIISEQGAVVYGPFERWAQQLIPAESKARAIVAHTWPAVASHLIYLCAKPVSA
jgi:2-polyprenyl-3-methyl-5-hydroxy-6-metoxy-1,4-benzoquinol methylase